MGQGLHRLVRQCQSDEGKRVALSALDSKAGKLVLDLAEVGVKRGKNFIPVVGTAAGAAASASAA